MNNMPEDKQQPQLVKTKWGFYQYEPKPSESELQEFYAKKYFQEGQGGYEVSYDAEELEWIRLCAWLIYQETRKSMSKSKGTLLDVGCGEGWLLNEFYQHGWVVEGIDFGKYAIEKYHPHLLDFFEQGNIYKLMEEKIQSSKVADVIFLGHVIEHVVDPVNLLKNVKRMMHKDSVLVMVAPNDFSLLHKYLFEKGYITKKFWLRFPDHLSYFNKESMSNVLQDLGFRIDTIVAGNPIDLNLMNDNANYIQDPSKGKNIHKFRIRTDNFLASIDRDKLLQMYEILGSMGVGRNLVYYCSIAP